MRLTEIIRGDKLFFDAVLALREQRGRQKPLPLVANGLSEGALEAFCTELTHEAREMGTGSLILVPDEVAMEKWVSRLREHGIRAAAFPRREWMVYEYVASHDTERERLFVLHEWMENRLDAIVATPDSATGFLPPKEKLASMVVSFLRGDILEPETLVTHLTAMGYNPSELVEGVGQFARRGGIVDVYPTSSPYPYRVEFFGDEVDRICLFDPVSQRIVENVDNICLLPAREVLLDDTAIQTIRQYITGQLAGATGERKKRLEGDLSLLGDKGEFLPRDRYLPLIYPENVTLTDYLGEKTPVWYMGTNAINEATRQMESLRREQTEGLLEAGYLMSQTAVLGISGKEWKKKLSSHILLHINPFGSGMLEQEGGLFGFRSRRLPTYADGLKGLCEDLGAFLQERYTAFLVCENKAGVTSTLEYLREAGIPCAEAPDTMTPGTWERGMAYATVGHISEGYDLIPSRIAVLSLLREGAASHRKLRPQKQTKHQAGQTILSYAELKCGDYVVHERYGIGVFEGLERITRDGVTRDYITIRYAGTDKLFIPADQLESVTKYIGAGSDTGSVKLSRMGSPAWQKAKTRAKGAAKEMAGELIRLYAERQRKPGISFYPQEEMENEFNGNFEYELTEPQMTAVHSILLDMEKPVPMDRLLLGDVGFGKTEVALRAAFRAIANGYQVAILVPTTILALQHYETALSRMRGFAIQVDMLSRFRTGREQKAILRRLARGETDLVIGTHSLLSRDVKFRRLGLLIIDEEQRFGVVQKEKIKEISRNVDVLTLSATPIPRTLNMAISGIRDMSILDEAPGERRPVQTYVMEHHDEIVKRAIQNELARGGQVLYLYNDTEHIDLVAGKWQKELPSHRVAFAHGKMEKDTIEDIWQALVRGEIDVLVCTTIVETGIDLPNANTMIVEHADRLGLSQLHQLRGRIGRSSRQAYAYFTYRAGKSLSEIATKRLSAIREYAEFGAGFRIALRDLEIRGAGDILGATQHGHIESVGYDMYIRLLESAVLEEQGKTPAAPFESTVEIKVDANLPPYYMESPSQRMDMYKKISCILTEEDMGEVLDELCDRFGDPPKEVIRLLNVALARATASLCHVKLVEYREGEIRLHTEGVDLKVWSEVFHRVEGIRIPSSRVPYLSIRVGKGQDPTKVAMDTLLQYHAVLQELKE